MNARKAITDLLDQAGIGLSAGSNLFGPQTGPNDFIPPDAVFVVFSGGSEVIRANGGGEIREPMVAVRVRWSAFEDGEDMALSILNTFRFNLPSGYLDIENLNSAPDYVGQTEDALHLWTLTVALKEEAGFL